MITLKTNKIQTFQIPYLAKFRQTFPNVENFEFLETDIHSLDQLNAMAQVQVKTKFTYLKMKLLSVKNVIPFNFN